MTADAIKQLIRNQLEDASRQFNRGLGIPFVPEVSAKYRDAARVKVETLRGLLSSIEAYELDEG